jgi:hypothetical protein
MSQQDAVISTLRYRDSARVIEWLCNVPGFERRFVAENCGQVVDAQIRCGNSLIFLGPDNTMTNVACAARWHFMRRPSAFASRTVRISMAQASSAESVTEPYDTPYDMALANIAARILKGISGASAPIAAGRAHKGEGHW